MSFTESDSQYSWIVGCKQSVRYGQQFTRAHTGQPDIFRTLVSITAVWIFRALAQGFVLQNCSYDEIFPYFSFSEVFFP